MRDKYPSVNDIVTIECPGLWQTKSGGILEVLFKLDYDLVMKFLDYDSLEFTKLPHLRGLRSYTVHDVPKDSIGAREWHKARNEIAFALNGTFQWRCEDIYGGKKEFILDGSHAVFTPHGLMHAYTALIDRSAIGVLANTLFDPEDQSTHDTYSYEEFDKLRVDLSK